MTHENCHERRDIKRARVKSGDRIQLSGLLRRPLSISLGGGGGGHDPLTPLTTGLLRNIDKEQRTTCGGKSSAPPLSKVKSLAIDSIAGTKVRVIPGGIDTAAVARPGRSLTTSGDLLY